MANLQLKMDFKLNNFSIFWIFSRVFKFPLHDYEISLPQSLFT